MARFGFGTFRGVESVFQRFCNCHTIHVGRGAEQHALVLNPYAPDRTNVRPRGARLRHELGFCLRTEDEGSLPTRDHEK